MERLIVSVDTEALKHNLDRAKKLAKSKKVLAMVKANAYGHGLELAAKAFSSADALGVATIEEALSLREYGIKCDIVLMQGVLSEHSLRKIAEHDISMVVHHKVQLEIIKSTDVHLKVWVKVNTGFNRLGFHPDELDDAINVLEKANVDIVCIMSHYAKANEKDDASVIKQQTTFIKVLTKYNYPVSLSNSAALLKYPFEQETWVRPGLILYGVSPFADKSAKDYGFTQAMSIKAQLISTYKIKAGDSVGYGAHFKAQKDMEIGIVSIGYGDGQQWRQNVEVPVLINGQKTYTIGQVAMDMIAISLENIDSYKIGDYVTLWGEGLSVNEVASALNTSAYALICSAPIQRERAIRLF